MEIKVKYYTIEFLKALHPELEYCDGTLYVGDDIIQEDVDWLLEDFYDGAELMYSPSANPEDDYPIYVSGKEYIKERFNGDYEKAFLSV